MEQEVGKQKTSTPSLKKKEKARDAGREEEGRSISPVVKRKRLSKSKPGRKAHVVSDEQEESGDDENAPSSDAEFYQRKASKTMSKPSSSISKKTKKSKSHVVDSEEDEVNSMDIDDVSDGAKRKSNGKSKSSSTGPTSSVKSKAPKSKATMEYKTPVRLLSDTSLAPT